MISREKCIQMKMEMGAETFKKQIGIRTGQTTGYLLFTIGAALVCPGVVQVVLEKGVHMLGTTRELVKKMGLKNIAVSMDGNSVLVTSHNYGLQDPDTFVWPENIENLVN